MTSHRAPEGSPRTAGGFTNAVVVLLLAAAVVALWTGRVREVFSEPSPYGEVRVTERRDGVRSLYLGRSPNRQTAMHPERPGDLILPYTRAMLAGVALAPDSARVLAIGLGGGALPTFIAATMPDAIVEVVEINPVVVRAAREWFGLREGPGLRVHVGDGRAFLERAPAGSWDLILVDAFSEEGVPESLSTVEFVRLVERALTPEGVAVSNLHTGNEVYRPMLATWLDVFPAAVEVDVPARRQRILVARHPASVAASPGGTRGSLLEAAAEFEERKGLAWDLEALVREGFRAPSPGAASVLRDPAPALTR